ncbi:MAG: ABC transporter ATP-binding protein, partial [Planctomycetaceae bacterium]|nr:ABC transporter ATP-binding protein [Planctomycetaceae bacterium]
NHSLPSTFQRVIPRRIWWRGPGRWVMFWSAIAAASLCVLVVVIALLAELQATHGEIELTRQELSLLEARVGPVDVQWFVPVTGGAERAKLTNGGLLPALVRVEGRWPWAHLLAMWHRATPGLRDNGSALVRLVILGAVTGILFTVALSRARARSLRAAMEVAGRQRVNLHRQALRLGPGELSGESRRTVHTLFTTEVDHIRQGITEWMQSVPRDPLMLVLLVLLPLSIDWRLTLQCLVPVAASWWFVHHERTRGRRRRALAEAQADTELRILAEGLDKARIVRGYSMEEYEQQQFEKHLERFTRGVTAGLQRERLAVWGARVMMVVCLGLILYMTAAKMLTPVNPLPVFGAVIVLLSFGSLVIVLESLLRLGVLRTDITVGADKVLRYLDRIPEVGQAVGAKFLEPVAKSIIFESVKYRVNGFTVLENLDLRLTAGTSTSIVSVDPLAALAVAYMLPRFIEPQEGRVLFDSEDINWGTLESLRAESIYVGGNDPFFTGTVLENITCGHPRYGLPEATEAAKMVHAHKFVTRLPQGYETLLGEHGEPLGVGQAFLLGLARAAVRKPAVLIIEEPVAKLDDDTKALLDDAYNKLLKGCTVIFLPSRLSTVRRSDQVVLINNGRVDAVGAHQELLRKSDTYRHWEYMTFNAFHRHEDAAGRAAS